jgi:hypothetical protein
MKSHTAFNMAFPKKILLVRDGLHFAEAEV